MSTSLPSVPQSWLDSLLAPASAFAGLRTAPLLRAWLALALIAGFSALGSWLFLHGMSPEWLVEQQLQATPGMSEAEIAQARPMLLEVAPHTGLIAVIASVLMTPLMCAVLALAYFAGERMLAKNRHGYGRWFLASAHSLLPLAIGALGLVGLALLAESPDQPLGMANYASLNNLVLGLTPGEPGYAPASSLDLFQLWAAILAGVAARVWTGIDWFRALLLGALPYLLFYGGWGLLA